MGFIATNIDKICGKCNFFNPKCCTNEKLGLSLHSLTKTARTGAVVQLVRIHACHAWGRGFESRPHRKSLKQCFGLFSFFPKKQTTMKLRLILIALMALLAFNASETSLAVNNRLSRNLVGINFRHPNVIPNFAVWKTITYRHWHKITNTHLCKRSYCSLYLKNAYCFTFYKHCCPIKI